MDLRQLMAGSIAGTLSTAVCHPIDLVKVRLQTDARADFRSRSFLHTFKVLKELKSLYGIRAWYQGWGANVAGAMSSWGLYFMFYEYLKANYQGELGYLGSSALAGGMTQLITNPIWLAKTRLCVQVPDGNPENYKGLVDCLRRTFNREGTRGIYRGLIPGLMSTSHGAIHFYFYEHLKMRLRSHIQNDSAYFFICSASSKAVALGITYPLQVIRSRVQVTNLNTISSVIKSFIHKEGLLTGAYKGLGPTLLRVLPSTCITLITYENVIKLLK